MMVLKIASIYFLQTLCSAHIISRAVEGLSPELIYEPGPRKPSDPVPFQRGYKELIEGDPISIVCIWFLEGKIKLPNGTIYPSTYFFKQYAKASDTGYYACSCHGKFLPSAWCAESRVYFYVRESSGPGLESGFVPLPSEQRQLVIAYQRDGTFILPCLATTHHLKGNIVLTRDGRRIDDEIVGYDERVGFKLPIPLVNPNYRYVCKMSRSDDWIAFSVEVRNPLNLPEYFYRRKRSIETNIVRGSRHLQNLNGESDGSS
ncbi:hypothetical protein WR25_05275 [Diploscapter pachys]|uniref:Ig-like domain-containing protein n=1 Tax=Diploscapter pachys TaxID=2018661 RepID=A0A2A2KQ35_9BILA|nr:hypothetical protein WR25_05275 [Diploscapter pachys]